MIMEDKKNTSQSLQSRAFAAQKSVGDRGALPQVFCGTIPPTKTGN
jgi:hypothetical protein